MSATTSQRDAQDDREIERILKMTDAEILASLTAEDVIGIEQIQQWLADEYGVRCDARQPATERTDDER